MKNPYKLLSENLNMEVAYFKFDRPPQLPYLIYAGEGSDNFTADNKVYDSDYNYRVEYYFDRKNEVIERQIEALFDENEIIWSKSADIYIDTERMFAIHYQIR